jgi:hypothetical protein
MPKNPFRADAEHFTKVRVYAPAVSALKRDPDVVDQMLDWAEDAAYAALVYGPHKTGHYGRSLFAEKIGGADAHARFGATDFKAWWIEFGAYGRVPAFPAQAPLRMAADALGMRVVSLKKRGRHGRGR